MQCWQCGKTVRPGAKLCIYCGTVLVDQDEYERPPDPKPDPKPSDAQERSRNATVSGSPFPPKLSGLKPRSVDPPANSQPSGGSEPLDSAEEPAYDRSPPARSRDRRGGDWGAGDLDPRPPDWDEPPPPRRYDDRAPRGGDPLDDPRAPHVLRPTHGPYGGPDDGGGRRPSRPVDSGGWGGAPAGYGGYAPRAAPPASYPPGRSAPAPSGGRYAQQGWDDDWRDRAPTGEYAAGYESDSMQAWQGDASGGQGGQGEHGLWPFYQDYADYPGGGHEARAGYGRPGDYQPNAPGYGPSDDSGWQESWQMPAGGRHQAGRGGRKQARPAQRKRRSPVVGIVLALLALVLVGVGVVERHALKQLLQGFSGGSSSTPFAFATYTPGPTPTVLPQFKQWVNTNAGYVLNYPQQWTEKSDNSPSGGQPDYVDTLQQANPFVEVAIEQAQINGSQTDQAVINAEVHAAEQRGATFTLSPGSTQTVSVGGERWLREEFDGTISGVQFHFALLSTHHLGRSYVILMLAQSATFTTLDKSAFEPMLGSFHFLG